MKKLHYIIPIIAMLFCNVAMATTNYSDVLYATNLVVWDYNNLTAGRITMYHGVLTLPFHAEFGSSAGELGISATNDIRISNIGDPSSKIYLETSGGGVRIDGGPLTVDGNITATGWVSGSTNILWATNIVWSTNAVGSIYATNAPDLSPVVSTNMLAVALDGTNLFKAAQAYYPTNSAATNTDMRVPYGDVNWVTGFYWPNLNSTSFSTTNYQTAVRILHGNGTGTNFGWPVNVRLYGNPYITNRTVCTFFYNPSVPETNLIVLPLW